MSINIYGGRIIKNCNDPSKFQEFMFSLKKKILQEFTKKYLWFFDFHFNALKPEYKKEWLEEDKFFDYKRYIESDVKEAVGEKFSIAFKFHENDIYLIPFSRSNVLNKAFKNFKSDLDYREYGYWNSVDKPKRISQSKWWGRLNNWNSVLDMEDGPGIPAHSMFLFEIYLFQEMGILPLRDRFNKMISKYIKSKDKDE